MECSTGGYQVRHSGNILPGSRGLLEDVSLLVCSKPFEFAEVEFGLEN